MVAQSAHFIEHGRIDTTLATLKIKFLMAWCKQVNKFHANKGHSIIVKRFKDAIRF